MKCQKAGRCLHATPEQEQAYQERAHIELEANRRHLHDLDNVFKLDDEIMSLNDLNRPRIFTPQQLNAIKQRSQVVGFWCAIGCIAFAASIGFLLGWLFNR